MLRPGLHRHGAHVCTAPHKHTHVIRIKQIFLNKQNQKGASKMTQRVSARAPEADHPSSVLQNHHSRRRELTPTNCALTTTRVPWHVHTLTHTQEHTCTKGYTPIHQKHWLLASKYKNTTPQGTFQSLIVGGLGGFALTCDFHSYDKTSNKILRKGGSSSRVQSARSVHQPSLACLQHHDAL